MITFVSCLCTFGIGIWIGRGFQMWILRQALEKIVKEDLIQSSAPPLYDHYVHVNIVKEGDSFLLYNADTEAFLAQGKTPEEVNSILRERFPRTYFTATFHNAKEMGYITDERL